ncbi:hypothetical protein JHK84_027514 [Glycine max]|nr:hypothetical protein JHK85_027909 [Glycine max]KAG5151042.1 hypothetical protein JHK84_027514 [Glycine max]
MNTSSSNVSDVNVIEVPFAYHRQWSPNYPNYVLFDYEGDKHFIKLHKYGNQFFFGDGLKELRRTHGIHESVLMRFVGRDKNTTFSVDVVGPLHQRAGPTIRHHVFTIDVSEDMIQHNYQLVLPLEASIYLTASKKYMVVDRGSGDCHLKVGDEVIFFYNIDQHLWEVLHRKQVKWDDKEDEADSP